MAARFPVLAFAAAALVAAFVPVPAASAAPPPNDTAATPAAFAPYTAANGRPAEQQAVAELVEATPDRGVPRCLGRDSFARTVWYSVPQAPVAQEVTVDASGRTLDPIDLAAFVRPEVVPAPGAVPAQLPLAPGLPNACAGVGDGGASAAEEPGSAVTLRVPPNHPVLVQVGRRGRAGSAADERAVLSLETRPVALFAPPPGDRADSATPTVGARPTPVVLASATLTSEDPAVPPCPSLGSVWRRLVPRNSAPRRIGVAGGGATTLTVFSGGTPSSREPLDCVNRSGPGRLEMVVPARRGRTLWIRVGSDSRTAPPATLDIDPAPNATVIDGGPGGFDPTTGGPGGGLPAACQTARIERARVSGPRLAGPPSAYDSARVPIGITVRGAPVCDAELRLYGPRGFLYARGRERYLAGRRTVQLPRRRTFVRGRYRLEVTGVSRLGERVAVRGEVTGRLG